MLVLDRKVGEQIRIGDDTVVEVLSVQEGKVRLGITAPGPVSIWRAELPPERRVPPPGRAAKNGNAPGPASV